MISPILGYLDPDFLVAMDETMANSRMPVLQMPNLERLAGLLATPAPLAIDFASAPGLGSLRSLEDLRYLSVDGNDPQDQATLDFLTGNRVLRWLSASGRALSTLQCSSARGRLSSKQAPSGDSSSRSSPPCCCAMPSPTPNYPTRPAWSYRRQSSSSPRPPTTRTTRARSTASRALWSVPWPHHLRNPVACS